MTAPATGSPLGERLRETVRDAASAGRSLPSEPALAAALGVSRPALREELARLERAGRLRAGGAVRRTGGVRRRPS